MANSGFISGGYVISAHETKTYTFWWPNPQDKGKEYFDVSISTQYDNIHRIIKPLIEVKRERGFTVLEGEGDANKTVLYILYLTLQNDNDIDVQFLANHVRVY